MFGLFLDGRRSAFGSFFARLDTDRREGAGVLRIRSGRRRFGSVADRRRLWYALAETRRLTNART